MHSCGFSCRFIFTPLKTREKFFEKCAKLDKKHDYQNQNPFELAQNFGNFRNSCLSLPNFFLISHSIILNHPPKTVTFEIWELWVFFRNIWNSISDTVKKGVRRGHSHQIHFIWSSKNLETGFRFQIVEMVKIYRRCRFPVVSLATKKLSKLLPAISFLRSSARHFN